MDISTRDLICVGRGFPDAPTVPRFFVGRDDPGAPNHAGCSLREGANRFCAVSGIT